MIKLKNGVGFWSLVLCVGPVFGIELHPAESGPLYGKTGKPDLGDIAQTTVPDCGFVAAMAAVVHSSPEFIQNMFKVTGPTDDASAVDFELYDPKKYDPKADSQVKNKVHVTCRDTFRYTADKSKVWWPGALEHGAIKAGMTSNKDDFELKGVQPPGSLYALTGIKTSEVSPPNADWVFNVAKDANDEKTPVILSTKDDTKKLIHAHAYAVFDANGEGDDRKITLFNPWGSQADYKIDDVMQDGYSITYFPDHHRLD